MQNVVSVQEASDWVESAQEDSEFPRRFRSLSTRLKEDFMGVKGVLKAGTKPAGLKPAGLNPAGVEF